VAVENSATGCKSLLEHESDEIDEKEIPLGSSLIIEKSSVSYRGMRSNQTAVKKRRSAQRSTTPRSSHERDNSKSNPISRVVDDSAQQQHPHSEPTAPQHKEQMGTSSSSKRIFDQSIVDMKISHSHHFRSWDKLENVPSRTTTSLSTSPKKDTWKLQSPSPPSQPQTQPHPQSQSQTQSKSQTKRLSSLKQSSDDSNVSDKSQSNHIQLIELPPPPPPIAQDFAPPLTISHSDTLLRNNNTNIDNKKHTNDANGSTHVTSDTKRPTSGPLNQNFIHLLEN
jgi:hypothetical protein